MKNKKQKKVFLLVCLGLVFLIFGHTLAGQFVFDDRSIVSHQALFSDINNLPEIALMGYWSDESGLYRPIVLLSYSLNYIFLGASPVNFHLVNLVLYALIGYFLFLFIQKIFPKPRKLAYLVSLLFLVLPIHTEVVANIVGRAEILALLFSLLLFLELLKRKSNPWKLGVWFFLAIASKEVAVAALPLALLVFFYKHKQQINKKKIIDFIPHGLLLFLSFFTYLSLRFLVLGQHFLTNNASLVENPLKFVSFSERIVASLQVLVIYLKKSFWPFNLCSDYSYNQIPIPDSFFNFKTLFGLICLLSFVFIFIYFFKKRPILSLGAGFFLFTYLPVSNLFFPIGTIAGERLIFYPSVGLVIFLAYGLIKLSKIKPVRIFSRLSLILFIGLMIFYGSVSFIRSIDWLNEKNLFVSAGQCASQSVLSRSNLATVYYLQGDYQRALEESLAAKEIYPNYPKGINNLGLVYWKLGQPEKARQEYYRALKNWPPYEGVYENLILLELSQENIQQAKKWIKLIFPADLEKQQIYLEKFGLE